MKLTPQRDVKQKLSAGEKIYLLRKHNRTTQAELAEVMRVRPEKIVRVERGEDEYAQAHIDAAKKHFNIVDLPLTERECIAFRERLYYWRSLLRAGRMSEANDIYSEIANIDKLESCDYDTTTLCKMLEVYHLMVEGKYDLAKEKLVIHQKSLNKFDIESLYHYNNSKGFLHIQQGNYDQSLDYYLKAYEISENHKGLMPEDDGRLYYNIAYSYTCMDIPYRAIFFLQKAKHAQTYDKDAKLFFYINQALATNYVKMNQLKEAERLLNQCLLKAESIKDNSFVSLVWFGFGYLNKKANNWSLAIKHFDDAMGRLPKDTLDFFPALYHKIHCVIRSRAFTEASQLLLQAKEKYDMNEMWQIYFTALWHYLKISSNMSTNNNDESIKYIEYRAIPYFISKHDYFTTIDYYSLLEQHYGKLNSTKKSLLMAKAIRDIYLKCYTNHGRDD